MSIDHTVLLPWAEASWLHTKGPSTVHHCATLEKLEAATLLDKGWALGFAAPPPPGPGALPVLIAYRMLASTGRLRLNRDPTPSPPLLPGNA